MRRVVGDDGNAVELKAFEDFGLGVGNRFLGAEVFDVRRRDGRNERDMRANLPGERRDLSLVVHAHFEHRIVGLTRHPRERKRHAGMIVVALDGAVRSAGRDAFERGVKRFLGAGLSDGAGDPEDDRFGTLARCSAERLECFERVVDEDVRMTDRLRDDRPSRTAFEGPFDEFVTVMDGSRHGDEQEPGFDLAAVKRHSGHFERRACRAAGRRFNFRRGPKGSHDDPLRSS
jgi:hypothetical protein